MLALGYNAPLARLHQVLLDQATGSVLGGAVPDLRLRAHRWDLRATTHVLASIVRVHLLYFTRRKYFKDQNIKHQNIKHQNIESRGVPPARISSIRPAIFLVS